MLEQADELGGAVRSAELTVPGFRHDVFSAWHPLFVVSSAYAELRADLERHGLAYRCAEAVTATAFSDHSSRVLSRSRRRTSSSSVPAQAMGRASPPIVTTSTPSIRKRWVCSPARW